MNFFNIIIIKIFLVMYIFSYLYYKFITNIFSAIFLFNIFNCYNFIVLNIKIVIALYCKRNNIIVTKYNIKNI